MVMIKRIALPTALRALLIPALAVAASAILPASPAQAQANFRACLAELKGAAAREGVSGATFDRAVAGLEPDMSLLELLNFQPEFRTAIWDYIAGLRRRGARGRRARPASGGNIPTRWPWQEQRFPASIPAT